MPTTTLDEVMNNLLKISQGDVKSLERANAEFAKSITGLTKLPAERLEVIHFVEGIETPSTDGAAESPENISPPQTEN